MQNVARVPYNSNVVENNYKPVQQQREQYKNLPKHYSKEEENPISRRGEMMKSFAGIFVASAALAGWILGQMAELDIDPFELIFKAKDELMKDKPITEKDIEKIKSSVKKTRENKVLNEIAFGVAAIAGIISGFALLCTIVASPKIIYDSKVNAYKKSREMDVYIKGNRAERELYSQLDGEAKEGYDKSQLQQEYMQLSVAKNKVPDFVFEDDKSSNKTAKTKQNRL